MERIDLEFPLIDISQLEAALDLSSSLHSFRCTFYFQGRQPWTTTVIATNKFQACFDAERKAQAIFGRTGHLHIEVI